MASCLRIPCVLLAVLSVIAGGAMAQTYPAKPVRVVIPWPGGGSNDIVGRVVFDKLSQSLGERFIIDNRPGAAGSIGTVPVAKAPPDGYTLMVQSTTHLVNGYVYKDLPYHVVKDFVGVSMLASQPGVLVVHPSLPVKTVKEFIALAKARPNEILYSSPGNGSAPHLSMALFISMTGIKIVHVPYKGGPPSVGAATSGETQATIATVGTVVSQIKAKRLRPLGVSTLKRLAQFPDVPTISESGVRGYERSPWIGVFAPAGTPKRILDRLSAEFKKALDQPDVQKVLRAQVLDPLHMSSDGFTALLKKEYEEYGKIVKLAGMKIE